EGRLPGAVRAEQGEAVAAEELEVDRPEPEGAALYDGAVERRDEVAGAAGGAQVEVQLPRLVRLLDAVEPVELLRVRLLHILALLLLAALAVAALLPLLHPPRLLLDALALADVAVPALVVARADAIALRRVLAPAAGVLDGHAARLVQLDNARDGAVEEGAVVRDDD